MGLGRLAHHGSKHASDAPHIKAIIIALIAHQQLGSLVIARPDSNVVVRFSVIKFGQTPVDEAQLAVKLNTQDK